VTVLPITLMKYAQQDAEPQVYRAMQPQCTDVTQNADLTTRFIVTWPNDRRKKRTFEIISEIAVVLAPFFGTNSSFPMECEYS
jgi:hypothetical protein